MRRKGRGKRDKQKRKLDELKTQSSAEWSRGSDSGGPAYSSSDFEELSTRAHLHTANFHRTQSPTAAVMVALQPDPGPDLADSAYSSSTVALAVGRLEPTDISLATTGSGPLPTPEPYASTVDAEPDAPHLTPDSTGRFEDLPANNSPIEQEAGAVARGPGQGQQREVAAETDEATMARRRAAKRVRSFKAATRDQTTRHEQSMQQSKDVADRKEKDRLKRIRLNQISKIANRVRAQQLQYEKDEAEARLLSPRLSNPAPQPQTAPTFEPSALPPAPHEDDDTRLTMNAVAAKLRASYAAPEPGVEAPSAASCASPAMNGTESRPASAAVADVGTASESATSGTESVTLKPRKLEGGPKHRRREHLFAHFLVVGAHSQDYIATGSVHSDGGAVQSDGGDTLSGGSMGSGGTSAHSGGNHSGLSGNASGGGSSSRSRNGSERAGKGALDEVVLPEVLYCFPHGKDLNAEAIADFCMPSGVHVRVLTREQAAVVQRPPSVEYLFRLSGGGADGGDVLYGVCLKTSQIHPFQDGSGRVLVFDQCVCVISSFPFLQLHFHVLRDLASFLRDAPDIDVKHCDPVMKEWWQWRVPRPGIPASFTHSLSKEPFVYKRPTPVANVDENTVLLREWALPLLLSSMSMEHVLSVVGYLLTEMQVIVVCDELQMLAATVTALVCLLSPLRWSGTLITTLPPRFDDYLESPVPYILGIEKLPPYFNTSEGQVVVYPRLNQVVLHSANMAAYHTLCLPRIQTLCHQLAGHDTLLRKAWKQTNTSPSSSNGSRTPSPRPSFTGLQSLLPPPSPGWAKFPTEDQQQALQAIYETVFDHLLTFACAVLELDAERITQKTLQTRRRRSSEGPSSGNGQSKSLHKMEWWRREWDDAGLAFMEHVLNSQIFSDFCFSSMAQSQHVAHRGKQSDSFSSFREPRRPQVPPVTDMLLHGGLVDLIEMMLTRTMPSEATPRNSPRPSATSSDEPPAAAPLDPRMRPGEVSEKSGQIVWCNGHCGGKMDTELCTLLCLEQWQQRWVEDKHRNVIASACVHGGKRSASGSKQDDRRVGSRTHLAQPRRPVTQGTPSSASGRTIQSASLASSSATSAASRSSMPASSVSALVASTSQDRKAGPHKMPTEQQTPRDQTNAAQPSMPQHALSDEQQRQAAVVAPVNANASQELAFQQRQSKKEKERRLRKERRDRRERRARRTDTVPLPARESSSPSKKHSSRRHCREQEKLPHRVMRHTAEGRHIVRKRQRRLERLAESSVVIGRAMRRFLARRRYLHMRARVLLIQHVMRTHLRRKAAATSIQRVWRSPHARQRSRTANRSSLDAGLAADECTTPVGGSAATNEADIQTGSAPNSAGSRTGVKQSPNWLLSKLGFKGRGSPERHSTYHHNTSEDRLGVSGSPPVPQPAVQARSPGTGYLLRKAKSEDLSSARQAQASSSTERLQSLLAVPEGSFGGEGGARGGGSGDGSEGGGGDSSGETGSVTRSSGLLAGDSGGGSSGNSSSMVDEPADVGGSGGMDGSDGGNDGGSGGGFFESVLAAGPQQPDVSSVGGRDGNPSAGQVIAGTSPADDLAVAASTVQTALPATLFRHPAQERREQQQQLLASFKESLAHGVVLVKHGRRGGSKRRVFTCDADCTTLSWKAERTTSFRRLVGNQSIKVAEVMAVAKGFSPRYLSQNALGEVEFATLQRLSLYLTLPNRTVDLEAADEDERDNLHAGFALLIADRRQAASFDSPGCVP